MIQQPELGKKISDLRKDKGLTQEELVAKCNLSVRTLQRIEAGEVTPRPITVKLIFEALGVSFEITMKDKGLIQKWLEHFYISFIDLFNLKTNTMKKIAVLSIILTSVAFGLLVITTDGNAQTNGEALSSIDKKKTSQDSSNNERILNIHCDGNMWTDNEEIIGSNIKFIYSGVKVSFNLIKLNSLTMEFKSTFGRGAIFPNKVDVLVSKRAIDANLINYSADKIEKLDGKIILKGNSKLTTSQNEYIEADEIIIELCDSIYDRKE